jgi:branched-chain amino acid transport system substrate-binding protein
MGNRLSIVAACAASAALGALAAGAAQAQDREEVFIGGALSLTGIQAPLDEPGLRGARVAVEVLNERGGILGRPVRFVNLDGMSDPVTVGNAAITLIDQGADLIVAPCDFDFGGPASRAAQEAGLVGISTCASDPLYSSWSLGDKQFTLSMWNTTMGAAAAEYAVNEQGWDTAYVVTDQFIAYTQSLSRYFIQHFEDIGGTVIAEDTYSQGDQDFSAQLARLRALEEEPDVIFVSSYMPDLGTIIRSIREAGIDAPIMGGDSYDDPGLFEALGEAYGSDIVFVTHTWMGPEAHPEMETFIQAYEAMHGEPPDTSFVATGWDTIMLMAEAAEIAGTTEGEAVATALEENEFNLLTGDLSYRSAEEGHQPDKAAALVRLTEGEPSFLGWRRPENPPAP